MTRVFFWIMASIGLATALSFGGLFILYLSMRGDTL